MLCSGILIKNSNEIKIHYSIKQRKQTVTSVFLKNHNLRVPEFKTYQKYQNLKQKQVTVASRKEHRRHVTLRLICKKEK